MLKHRVDVALERRERRDRRARHQDLARGRRLEAGDHPERRGLARAGGAEQRQELARRDVQRQVVDRCEVAEPLREVVQLEDRRGHGYLAAFTSFQISWYFSRRGLHCQKLTLLP